MKTKVMPETEPTHHLSRWQRWRQTTLSNKIMSVSTVVMSIATVVIMAATIANVWVARLQWRAMEDSGRQTDRLLCLYQKQLDETAKLAAAADKANLLASEYFEEVQRPLLAVEGIDLDGPPVFREAHALPGMPTLSLRLHVNYKNSGVSVALGAVTEVDIAGPEKKWSQDGWWRIPCKNLDKLRRPVPVPLGFMVAPGWEIHDGRNANSMTIPFEKAKSGQWLLVGCVIYHDLSMRMHHTSFVFQPDMTTDPKNVKFLYVPGYIESD